MLAGHSGLNAFRIFTQGGQALEIRRPEAFEPAPLSQSGAESEKCFATSAPQLGRTHNEDKICGYYSGLAVDHNE